MFYFFNLHTHIRIYGLIDQKQTVISVIRYQVRTHKPKLNQLSVNISLQRSRDYSILFIL